MQNGARNAWKRLRKARDDDDDDGAHCTVSGAHYNSLLCCVESENHDKHLH